MKEIKLSQSRVALIDDEDYEMLIKNKWSSYAMANTFYATRATTINSKNVRYLMHRVVFGKMCVGFKIDHIDHNGLNNQKNNLRLCTTSQNAMNKVANKNSSSRFKGVSFNKPTQKWMAQIKVSGVHKNLGRYLTETEAAIAYNKEARRSFGEFAYINSII